MKNWKIPAVIGGVVLLLIMIVAGSYNSMVASRESVNTAWSKVESQYQRRSDLIPNLVNTVKGAANFEQETLTKVVEARAKATQIKVDANNPDDIAKFQQAQSAQSAVGGCRKLSTTQSNGKLQRLAIAVRRYRKSYNCGAQ